MSKIIVHCNCCNTSYDLTEWKKLNYLGITEMDGEESPAALEFRNCPCGNTFHVGLDSNGEII